MNTFELTLDLDKGHGPLQTVTIRQGDKNATTIVATVCDHGVQLAIAGLSARFCMPLPDNAHYYRKAAAYSEGTVTVTVDETSAASVAGITHAAYFELLQGSTVIASTASFAVVVLPSATSGKTIGETYDGEVERAIAALDAVTAGIPAEVAEDVDAWLAAHPEATTTVQDNSITDAKLIQSGGVLDRVGRLWWRLENLLTNTPAEADVVTVHDAAKTPLAGLALYGRSTQDGTPTPDAPVAIESVDSLAIKAAGKNVTPFFSVPFEGAEGYWFAVSNLATYGTRLADGWAHLEFDTRNLNVSPFINKAAIAPSTTYTIMLEVRNATALSNCRLYAYTDRQSPFAVTKSVFLTGEGTYRLTVTTKDDLSSRAITHVRIFIGGASGGDGVSVNADFRLSLYKGEYEGEYVPSDSSVTTVDLQGHVLRSLPDGTRDELRVDEYGHAILTQRVGHVVLNGTETWTGSGTYADTYSTTAILSTVLKGMPNSRANPLWCDHGTAQSVTAIQGGTVGVAIAYSGNVYVRLGSFGSTSALVTWLQSNPMELLYPLAEPATHDLGTIPATPLPSPDLTVTTSPATTLALTYERDLNTTLARLEAAIADAATA